MSASVDIRPLHEDGAAGPAHVIRDDAEAIAMAHRLAPSIAAGAITRDRDRRLPHDEIDALSQAGLWGITIPKEYGGAGVSSAALAEVTAILSAADASIGQIPQNHYFMIEAIRLVGSEAQKRFLFARVLAGERIGNALSEFSSRSVHEYETTVLPAGTGFVLNGRKFYSTGALFAHWIAAGARDGEGKLRLVIMRRETPGVQIVDDWSSFGQRTTGSGTTLFDRVHVDQSAVLSYHLAFDRPSPLGPFAQIIHAAVEQGIARTALADTIAFVRDKSRPWIDAGIARASDDPYVISAIGELTIRLHAGDALLARAGAAVDAARAAAHADSVAAASVAVAEAKVWTTETALAAANRLFELAGSRASLAEHGLDRHWRNARTHTLHDPVRWKFHAIGNHALNGVKPPRHGAL